MTAIRKDHYETRQLHLEFALADNAAVALANTRHSIANHLVDNLLGRLSFIDNSCSLAHQEWSSVIHSIIVKVVT
jgi:hypothetical protein